MDGIERDVPVTVQGIFQGRTGEQIPMELRLTRFGCPNHDLFAVSCRDLTEQEPLEERLRDLSEGRKTEEELRRVNTELSKQTTHLREVNQILFDSEQRLRLAIKTGKIGLWVWNSTNIDNSGDWSDRLKEIFGLPLDTVVTHELFLKCVHPEGSRARGSKCQGRTGRSQWRRIQRRISDNRSSRRFRTLGDCQRPGFL
jgi:PAS domain-containing protein